MFAAGVVVVNFAATTLQVQVPQGAGSTTTVSTTINLLASTESFTVSGGGQRRELRPPTGSRWGRCRSPGPSLGLAGESFSKGTLNLTIAIGVASASLSFGGSAVGRGITASLTNVLGTFNVQVNLIKLIPAIAWPRTSRASSAHSTCRAASA